MSQSSVKKKHRIKTQTKQLHSASNTGSRQGILQLQKTEEPKTFIKWSFSRYKKLNASKEVKEFPKLPQRSNSARDKTKGNQCTGNTSAS